MRVFVSELFVCLYVASRDFVSVSPDLSLENPASKALPNETK
jgi:hypothetical protein